MENTHFSIGDIMKNWWAFPVGFLFSVPVLFFLGAATGSFVWILGFDVTLPVVGVMFGFLIPAMLEVCVLLLVALKSNRFEAGRGFFAGMLACAFLSVLNSIFGLASYFLTSVLT